MFYKVFRYVNIINSQVCKKTLEPDWDHEMFIDVHEGGDNQVKIELFDKDKIGKDETMGWTTVDVRRISKQGSILEVGGLVDNCFI